MMETKIIEEQLKLKLCKNEEHLASLGQNLVVLIKKKSV